MKPIFSDIFNRWRHTLGYGVHSPLAYRIVKECIRPDKRYAMYADSRIDFLFADDRKRCVQLKMLIRLINLLKISDIMIPNCPKKIRQILSDAYPGLHLRTDAQKAKNVGLIVVFDNSQLANAANILHLACSERDCEWGLLLLGERQCPDSLADRLKPATGSLLDSASLIIRGGHFSLYLKRLGMHRIEYDVL